MSECKDYDVWWGRSRKVRVCQWYSLGCDLKTCKDLAKFCAIGSCHVPKTPGQLRILPSPDKVHTMSCGMRQKIWMQLAPEIRSNFYNQNLSSLQCRTHGLLHLIDIRYGQFPAYLLSIFYSTLGFSSGVYVSKYMILFLSPISAKNF